MTHFMMECITYGKDSVNVFYDGENCFFRLLDINRLFDGKIEHYTDNYFLVNVPQVTNTTLVNATRVISDTTLLETADSIYEGLHDKSLKNHKNIGTRLSKIIDFVLYAKDIFKSSRPRKQEFTDRKICAKCRYAYFENATQTAAKFKWCNYLSETGESRPHEGSLCYGFEQKQRKRRS